ncbi:pyruvate kinase [Candidatus Saccharibacteria bacterium]|nr:pyruvate kinase [Candidatus Saccharibacteria bacterium]
MPSVNQKELSSANLANLNQTKIVVTVGPATNSYELIRDAINAGAVGMRLNFSHGNHTEKSREIEWIRKASIECGRPVAIIQDLQGPKIRLGDFEGVVPIKRGQELVLQYKPDFLHDGYLPVQYDLSKKVKRGESILLYDGKIRGVISSVRPSERLVSVRIENDGVLVQRKGINLPDTDLGGDIITKKDRQDIIFGAESDIDYIALSFVQTADDVQELRRLLKNLSSSAKIITKVETKRALENLEEIVQASDGVMVARGDLAVETIPESVPVWQREIIRLCLRHHKVSIVATQMLASMLEQPEPTRAEVSDVATAVIVGADAVMLSDETAVGRYPIEAIEIMKRIVMYTQENATVTATFAQKEVSTLGEAIATSAINLAALIDAVAIVAETKTGATAVAIAGGRPKVPVIVVTPEARVAQQLALLHGTKVYVRPDDKYAATKLTDWLRSELILKKGDTIIVASGQYPGTAGGTDTIKVRVLE